MNRGEIELNYMSNESKSHHKNTNRVIKIKVSVGPH